MRECPTDIRSMFAGEFYTSEGTIDEVSVSTHRTMAMIERCFSCSPVNLYEMITGPWVSLVPYQLKCS